MNGFVRCFLKFKVYISFFFLLIIFFSIPFCVFALTPQVNDIRIPSEFGSVSDSFFGDSDKLVFLINDEHDNSRLQLSIAKLIDFIASYYDVELVGVEGAEDSVDLDRLSSFYSHAAKNDISSFYVKSGLMTGADYAALSSSSSVKFFGMHYILLICWI